QRRDIPRSQAALFRPSLAVIGASNAKDYNPKKLSTSVMKEEYELRSPYVAKASSWGHSFTYTLRPGIYTRTFELKDGYILIGQDKSFEQSAFWEPRNKPAWTERHEYQGAIFVYKDLKRGARPLFFVPNYLGNGLDSNTAQGIAQRTVTGSTGASAAGGALGGIIVNSIIASRTGKILTVDELNEDPALRSLLEIK
ncbi:hypothetical protein, partial [Xanthomonas hortorum]